jgi:hypothetical protein
LAPVPLKGIGIALAPVAGEAGGYAVFGGAQPAAALRENMIDGFRWFSAVNAGFVCKRVEILSPASNAKFGAQILKENRIPGVHPLGSVAESLPAVAGMSMCRAMQF